MITTPTRLSRLLALLLALVLLLTGCNQGMPEQAGEYQLKPNSLTWNGEEYRFAWVDGSGALHWASGDDVQLVQGERTYLEMRDGRPIVHLAADEPVTVLGRDQQGDFTSSWFPFLAGAALGDALGGRDRTVVVNEPDSGTRQIPPSQPAYRYPPTDSFGRGDSLRGSIANDKPTSPNYRKVRPVTDAVSGQSGGTGGGSAASSKAPSFSSGQAGGSGAGTAASAKGVAPASGQAGGTGVGSAASSKGTFAGSSRAPSIGASGGAGGGKVPSVGTSGGKSSGGFFGARSSGGFKGGRR